MNSNMKKLFVLLSFIALAVSATYVLLNAQNTTNSSLTEDYCSAISVRFTIDYRTSFNSMSELYEDNRKKGLPNYITLDQILTYFNLFEKKVLIDIEKNRIIPKFDEFIERLYRLALERYNKSDSTTRTSLRGLIAYLSVIKKLNSPDFTPIPDVTADVNTELSTIYRHSGIIKSKILNSYEDFSQYVPRGYYAEDEQLKRYFLASLYASRMKFYLTSSAATEIDSNTALWHTYLALQISSLINSDDELKELYKELLAYHEMLYGTPDDLTPMDIVGFTHQSDDIAKVQKEILNWAKKNGRYPRIVSEFVDLNRLEPGLKVQDVIIGVKLLPQRITPDALVFQELVYNKVTLFSDSTVNPPPFTLTMKNNRPVRGMPRGFDLFAALGNCYAMKLLDDYRDSHYQNYLEQLTTTHNELIKLISTPYRSWYLQDIIIARQTSILDIEPRPERPFNTAFGFWIQSHHNYVLYAKQSYTVAEKSVSFANDRKYAYIDPAPHVYLILKNRVNAMKQYLTDDKLKKFASRFESILDTLINISIDELSGLLPTGQHADLLNNLDKEFSHALGRDTPIIIDVHTEPQAELVLQEAVGKPITIFAEYGSIRFRGAIYSIFEFKQPIANRLDDGAWSRVLDKYEDWKLFFRTE